MLSARELTRILGMPIKAVEKVKHIQVQIIAKAI
jgi:hypothetical protein